MIKSFTYTDSHCHLNMLDKKDNKPTIDYFVTNAKKRNVSNILSVCTKLEELEDILYIAEKYSTIWASVGVHPLDITSKITNVEQIVELSSHSKIVAIGETGLDFHYSVETKEAQIKSFVEHLEAGKVANLPVIVHTREAQKETIDLLKNHASKDAVGVMHCFTEDITMAKQALDLGFYISFSGIVTFKNADNLREVAKYVPADKILVETDSPYLAPVPFRGKSNEPSFVVEVSDFVADLRNINKEKFAAITTANFFNLFKKARTS